MKQQYGIKCIVGDEASDLMSVSHDQSDWLHTNRGWERWHKSSAFPYDDLNSAYTELQSISNDYNSYSYSVDELSTAEINILSIAEPRKTSNLVIGATGPTGMRAAEPTGIQGITGISQLIYWQDMSGQTGPY